MPPDGLSGSGGSNDLSGEDKGLESLHPFRFASANRAAALEQVTVLGMRLQMTGQDKPEALREQNVAILAALALANEDFEPGQINVANLDANQFGDPDRS